MRVLAGLTLATVLFSDAANVDKPVLRSGAGIPMRMLLIGLPGTIALGFLCGWLLGVTFFHNNRRLFRVAFGYRNQNLVAP